MFIMCLLKWPSWLVSWQRISIPEIRNHEWFLKNLPADLMNDNTVNSQFDESDQPGQSIEEIMQIIAEATVPPAGTQNLNHYLTGDNTKHNVFRFLVLVFISSQCLKNFSLMDKQEAWT